MITGSLAACLLALEQARLNKVKTDKQKRKNPTPARNTLADLTTNTDQGKTSLTGEDGGGNNTASEDMDQDSADSAT